MLSPLVTTIISFVIVILITYVEYEISLYYIRRAKGSCLVLTNSTISFALCLSILVVYVNDIYALVYQGDLGVIRIMMSTMLLLYCIHTVIILPLLALLVYDRNAEVIFPKFRNRYTLFVIIELVVSVVVLFGVLSGKHLRSAQDLVFKALSMSEVEDYCYVIYVLVLIYIIGIFPSIFYLSIGFVAVPLSNVFRRQKRSDVADVFASSIPVVQYVNLEETPNINESFITDYQELDMAGGTLQSITASFSPREKIHKQSVVIKSDYNKGWVTAILDSHPRVQKVTGILSLLATIMVLIFLISGIFARLDHGEIRYGFLLTQSYPDDTLLDTILYSLHSIHLDVFFFAFVVIFIANSMMQGQIVAGVRFYNSQPKWLMYMNTSASTMLVFMYNNATSIAFILSLIYIMAPHYTMFGMQTTKVGTSTTTACNILLSPDNPLNCELTSVSSFFVAAEAETIVFGIVEIVCCFLLLLFIVLLVVWPIIYMSLGRKFPYAFSTFMNNVNWITLQDRADEERRNGSFYIVCTRFNCVPLIRIVFRLCYTNK